MLSITPFVVKQSTKQFQHRKKKKKKKKEEEVRIN